MPDTINHWGVKSIGIGQTAEDLWNAACNYWMWCEMSPVYKPMMVNGDIKYLPIPRPFTLAGLCIHCGITAEYLKDVSKNPDAKEFYLVAQRILQVTYTQKLENAIAGVYNAPIVARELQVGEAEATGKLPAIVRVTVLQNDAPKMLTNEQDANS